MARWIWKSVLLLVISSVSVGAFAQQSPTGRPDPLVVGKQAIQHEDWANARKFFEAYLHDDPENVEAQFYLGFALFGEKQYPQAEQTFQKLISANPKLWSAHVSLAEVYALEGRWSDFDRERQVVRDARHSGEPGINRTGGDVIDVLYVGDERYIVHEYDPLAGRFHARYNFSHVNKQGKVDYWIACESDDVDQSSFAQKHPNKAAAGERSFSLDSYSQTLNADGQVVRQTHGTIKFYWDGEPTYEAVRADVLGVLEHRTKPMSTTAAPVSQQAPPAQQPQ